MLQRLDRASIWAFHEFGAHAMTRHHRLLGPIKAVARRQIRRGIADPALRRRGHAARRSSAASGSCSPTTGTRRSRATTSRSSRTAIETVTPGGIRAGGRERAADVLVLATGFKSHAFVAPLEIAGPGGRTLAEEWGDVPRAYLGVTVPGFPNLFLLYGPNTNGGTGSVVATIESSMQPRARRAGGAAPRRRLHASRSAARPPTPSTADLRDALRRTVWHTRLHELVRRRARQRPEPVALVWSEYRRRTARLDPAAYALS